MKYQRYQRSFTDLGIPDELGEQYLQFTGEKVSDYMTRAMPEDAAAQWFGAAPPDLTLVARVRGTDWIYTYLRAFYVDESRPFGVNNTVFPEVGMPHVLQPLQGTPTRTYEEQMVDGEMVKRYVGIKSDGTGSMSPDEYDQAVADIVNFLEYTGEPAKLESHKIGKWVLILLPYCLCLFTCSRKITGEKCTNRTDLCIIPKGGFSPPFLAFVIRSL